MTVQLARADDLDEYPLSADERLDSHYFMPWERRRWLNCDMRLKGTAECRALYFDLINISYDQSPVGTLPTDMAVLAKMLFVDRGHFEQLCRLEFGPLHKWRRVSCEGEVRFMHPMVLRSLHDAISRREDHRARSDAANTKKRLQRLRSVIGGQWTELAKNDACILWVDEWLQEQGCEYRTSSWVERAVSAWHNHSFSIERMRKMDAR
ncbi:hypothetical protein PAF17_10460 [Paracoccus sp. Z330]|uniref:Uncharacterized protein n=1 Tax=Paracoccus onchidii TaxID=3017813 RepID=A0ABT4ZEX6_9RHOB|nr:hypothetical protein [Paracoccus onchidii]MDB6177922.1 hypothetical protein [Paracoccus onchidii]